MDMMDPGRKLVGESNRRLEDWGLVNPETAAKYQDRQVKIWRRSYADTR